MNAIILCGGLSTRLGDITKSIPKVLLEIGDGYTVLDYQLKKLRTELGITKVILAAGHLSDVLLKEVGNERDGVELIYAIEPERLGTGGAIKFAMENENINPEQATIILNGDILTTDNLQEIAMCLPAGEDGVILGSHVPDSASYGTLEFESQSKHLISFKEKEGIHNPGYINGGIYIFNPQIKKYFPSDRKNFSIEYDVFPNVKNLYVYPSEETWIDIGVPERLIQAKDELWTIFKNFGLKKDLYKN